MNYQNFLWVGLGSALGGIMRYATSLIIPIKTYKNIPVSTLLVNLTGCFLIGLLLGPNPKIDSSLKIFLAIGILGGFTTFSSFSNESLYLLNHHKDIFVIYLITSVLGGVLITFIGTQLNNLF